MNYVIYRFTFPDGKVYIGLSKDAYQRWKGHKHCPKGEVGEAIRRFGFDSVKREILDTGDKEYIRSIEDRIIREHKARDPEFGYNVAPGGGCGRTKHNNQTRVVTVVLDRPTVEKARELGDGNLSLGIRRAFGKSDIQLQIEAKYPELATY